MDTSFPVSHYIDVALESSCDTLIALEVVRRVVREQDAGSRTLRAISSLRRTIEELRAIRTEASPHGLPCGFVIAANGSSANGRPVLAESDRSFS